VLVVDWKDSETKAHESLDGYKLMLADTRVDIFIALLNDRSIVVQVETFVSK
jgi:hypothetical protein